MTTITVYFVKCGEHSYHYFNEPDAVQYARLHDECTITEVVAYYQGEQIVRTIERDIVY